MSSISFLFQKCGAQNPPVIAGLHLSFLKAAECKCGSGRPRMWPLPALAAPPLRLPTTRLVNMPVTTSSLLNNSSRSVSVGVSGHTTADQWTRSRWRPQSGRLTDQQTPLQHTELGCTESPGPKTSDALNHFLAD